VKLCDLMKRGITIPRNGSTVWLSDLLRKHGGKTSEELKADGK